MTMHPQIFGSGMAAEIKPARTSRAVAAGPNLSNDARAESVVAELLSGPSHPARAGAKRSCCGFGFESSFCISGWMGELPARAENAAIRTMTCNQPCNHGRIPAWMRVRMAMAAACVRSGAMPSIRQSHFPLSRVYEKASREVSFLAKSKEVKQPGN